MAVHGAHRQVQPLGDGLAGQSGLSQQGDFPFPAGKRRRRQAQDQAGGAGSVAVVQEALPPGWRRRPPARRDPARRWAWLAGAEHSAACSHIVIPAQASAAWSRPAPFPAAIASAWVAAAWMSGPWTHLGQVRQTRGDLDLAEARAEWSASTSNSTSPSARAVDAAARNSSTARLDSPLPPTPRPARWRPGTIAHGLTGVPGRRSRRGTAAAAPSGVAGEGERLGQARQAQAADRGPVDLVEDRHRFPEMTDGAGRRPWASDAHPSDPAATPWA